MESDRTDLTGAGDAMDATVGGATSDLTDPAATGTADNLTDTGVTDIGAMTTAPMDTDMPDAGAMDVNTVILGVDVDGDDIPDMVIIDTIMSDVDVAADDPGASTDFAAMDTDLGMDASNAVTGTSDPVYNLVSVLYHALQGAQTTVIYTDDAAYSGDAELVDFFAEIQAQDRDRAERAKALLRRYLA